MKTPRFALSLIGAVAIALGASSSEAQTLNPADSGTHRSTQRFHVLAGEGGSLFRMVRQHSTGAPERDAAFVVHYKPETKWFEVYTKAYTKVPRYHVEKAGEAIQVFRLDKGERRDEPAYKIETKGGESSIYRHAQGRTAWYRCAVIRVEAEKKRTLVFTTGSGDTPLNWAHRRIEHADLANVKGFPAGTIPLADLAAVLAAVDASRGS